MCVDTTPRMKDISDDIRETAVATDQSGKCYQALSKLVAHHSIVRKIIRGDGLVVCLWCTHANLPLTGVIAPADLHDPNLDRSSYSWMNGKIIDKE